LWEAEIYSYRRLPNGLVTDEVIKANDHQMDNWRYLASARLKFVKGKARTAKSGWTTEYIKRKKERARDREGEGNSVALY
jgi:hypothetical protein